MLNMLGFRLYAGIMLNFMTISFSMLYSHSARADLSPAAATGKKLLEVAGTGVSVAGTLVGVTELFCKASKGKSWQPSACKDSKLAEHISGMTAIERQEFLELYIRKLPADRKRAFLKALYDDLSDSAKTTLQGTLSNDELDSLDIKRIEKTVRLIADKIISKKLFTIQLVYCDAAKQAACNGKINPMGGIKCGTNYQGRYEHIVHSFEFTGIIRETGQTQTKSYSSATIEDGKISLWGRQLLFDADGDVFDGDCGRVGKLVFD